MRTVIKRNKEAELGACIEQTFALGIFAHRVHIRAIGNSSSDCAPIFSEICRFENVRFEIVELMPIHSYVCCVGVVRRRVDDTDGAPLWHLRRHF